MQRLKNGKFDPVYRCWKAIRTRCYRKKDKSYKNYGARGIIVCDRWLKSYKSFKKDMGLRPENSSIERIDNNGNYELSNCKWGTKKEQGNNRRATRKFEYNGMTKSIVQWAEYFQIAEGKFYSYVHRRGFEWTIKNLDYIRESRLGHYRFLSSFK